MAKGSKLKNIIRSIAEQKGITMKELSLSVGKDYDAFIGQVDRGRMSVPELQKVFKAMGEEVVFTIENGNKYQLES